jgi:hypothetical protein
MGCNTRCQVRCPLHFNWGVLFLSCVRSTVLDCVENIGPVGFVSIFICVIII